MDHRGSPQRVFKFKLPGERFFLVFDLFLSFGFTVWYHRVLSIWIYCLGRWSLRGEQYVKMLTEVPWEGLCVWARKLWAGPGPAPA